MNLHADLFTIGSMSISTWTIIGWTGGLCFALRWGLQVWFRKRTGQTHLPTSFWWMSLVGAAMTLAYFTFGNPDSVGILQNILPLGLATWNIFMDYADRSGVAKR